jgi:hypothetical protein
MSTSREVILDTTTIDNCEHCEKPFLIGDSFTVDANGRILRCMHWPLISRAQLPSAVQVGGAEVPGVSSEINTPTNSSEVRMFLSKSMSVSRGVQVRRYHGTGPLTVQTSRGEVKAYPGDHIVEFPYSRAARPGEEGKTVLRTQTFVVPEDVAKQMNIFVSDEELNAQLEEARLRDAGQFGNSTQVSSVVEEPAAPATPATTKQTGNL